ncbi:SAF domain-containing protein [Ornithinimicrobium pratense]|uniref:SAF domain-containing protein n=1 Tax=Ornithinimicrobium pratense TaxID=2593973 RepID=A0A5J6V1H2_9MICO|nr:SAF domain-containing protein [Ornithinimicrobium pratense]QFG67425.1 hypothetical protein FY030_00630 [Ornithinimicrobium pratense]
MSTTTAARPGAAGDRLPSRPRDRRPALAILALLLVLLGALGSALLVYRTGERVQVLVAQGPIQQGQTVTADDFSVTEIAFDDGTQVVPAGSLGQFVGSTSVAYVPEGSIISAQMFTTRALAPAAAEQVGVVVASVGRPSSAVQVNDIVRVYRTDPSGTAAATDAEELVAAAKVVAVGPVLETRDTVHVTLLLPQDAAPSVISASAAGTAAVSILASDTAPSVDWRTE